MRRRDGGRYSAGLDVSPRMTQADMPSVFGGHAISSAQLGEGHAACCVILSQSDDGFLSMLCQNTFFARNVAILATHIRQVLGMGAGENMGWVATRRIIARVAPLKPLWKRLALGVSIGDLVRVIVDALVSQRPITEPRPRALPFPAIIGTAFVDFVPDRAGERAMRPPRVGIGEWLFAAATDKVSALFAHSDDCSGAHNDRQAEAAYA